MIGRKESQRCYFIELIKEAVTNSLTPFFVKAKNCVTNQKNKPLPRVGEGEKGNGLSDNKPVLFLTEGNRDVAGLL